MQQKFRLLGRSAVLPQVDSSCPGYPATIARHLYMAVLPDRPDHPHERREQAFRLPALAAYITDVNWPAFRKIDFLRAIRASSSANVGSAADQEATNSNTGCPTRRALTDDDAHHVTPIADVLEDSKRNT